MLMSTYMRGCRLNTSGVSLLEGPCVKAHAGVQTPCKTSKEAILLLHGAALQAMHIRVGLPLSYPTTGLSHARKLSCNNLS